MRVGWQADERAHHKQRWSARASLASAALAALLPLLYGGVAGVLLLLVGAGGIALTVAGLWWTLTRRGS
ncbi:diacylglycerol kinase, partial [Streptomyces lavendulocolor]